MLRHLIILWASITIFAMQYSTLNAVTSFKESFWRAGRRKGDTVQAVSWETFELFLRHFFDCVEGTSRRDIIFHKTLSYDADEGEEKFSPIFNIVSVDRRMRRWVRFVEKVVVDSAQIE